jgi:antirestriction protein ArdC
VRLRLAVLDDLQSGQKLGGQVRKGEKSTIAIFYKSYTKEVEAPTPAKPTKVVAS